MRDQHHAVEHRNAQQRDEAHGGRHRQVLARRTQRRHAAHQRERDVGNDQQRLPGRAEGQHQQHEDGAQRQRHHQRQPCGGALLVLELAAPDDAHVLEAGITGDGRLGISHKAGQVAPFDVDLHHGEACAVFVVHAHGAVAGRQCGQGSQWPVAAVRRRHQQAGQAFGRLAQRRPAAQDERRARHAFGHDANALAFHQGAQLRLQAIATEPGLAQRRAVERHLQVLHAAVAGRDDFGGPGHRAHARGHGLGGSVQPRQVGIEDLDGHVAACAGQHFGDAHFYGLGEAVDEPWKALHDAAYGLGDVFLAAAPLVARAQHQEGIGLVQAHGVQAQIVRARARDDGADLGHLLQQRALHAPVHVQRSGQRDGGRLLQLHDHVALIHGGHEGLAHGQVEHGRPGQRCPGNAEDRRPVGQAPALHAFEAPGHAPHQPGFIAAMRAQQQRGQRRHHGEGDEHRGPQRQHDGQRHRREQLALQPLQREQRQEHDGDDGHAGQHGHGDRRDRLADQHGPVLRRGTACCFDGRCARRLIRQRGLYVLHHHHRSIHQHAQGDGQAAQAHQVGRQARMAHQQEGGQHGQRQRGRHHQGRPQPAQEQVERDQHQHAGLDQGAHHGARSARDQVAPVVEDLGAHALGQPGSQFVQPRLHGVHQAARIHPAQSQHQALHGFATPVAADGAVARGFAQAHGGHIAHGGGNAPLMGRRHDNGAQVVQPAHAAFHAHHPVLFPAVQPACAVVAVVGLQRLAQLVQRHAARPQPGGVGDHLVAAHHAAQGIHVGHAGHGAQRRANHPVQHMAALGQRPLLTVDGEHEHLAQRRGDGGKPAFGRGGQVALQAGQPLGHLLARPVHVRAFAEIHGHVADAVFGH